MTVFDPPVRKLMEGGDAASYILASLFLKNPDEIVWWHLLRETDRMELGLPRMNTAPLTKEEWHILMPFTGWTRYNPTNSYKLLLRRKRSYEFRQTLLAGRPLKALQKHSGPP